MSSKVLVRVALLIALGAGGGSTAFAQLQSGRILGTIYDPQRAGIPGTTVTVTNVATNIARTTVTDAEGLRHHAAGPRDLQRERRSSRLSEDRAGGARADRRSVGSCDGLKDRSKNALWTVSEHEVKRLGGLSC